MTTLAPDIRKRERTAWLLWTGLILMFFVLQAILWTTAITLTAGDASHAVVANYDEQAFQWDEVKQQRADSVELGWEADLKVDSSGDPSGNRVITIVLKDRSGKPVTDATFGLRVFHRARAAQAKDLKLQEVGPGVYSGSVQIQQAGLWLFSGSAICGDDRYLLERQLQLKLNRNL